MIDSAAFTSPISGAKRRPNKYKRVQYPIKTVDVIAIFSRSQERDK